MKWFERAVVFVFGTMIAVVFVLGMTGVRSGEMETAIGPTEGGPAIDQPTVPVKTPITMKDGTGDASGTDAATSDVAKEKPMTAKAMFGAGCFWGVEATFRKVKGVAGTAVGYSGGTKENPTYRQVCSGTTGHAEVVLVEFDPEVVSYKELLDVFWKSHNPTTPNRQGPDVGSQYRSAIFYLNEDQKTTAEESKSNLAASGRYDDREIVTEITKAGDFWHAEDYHQQYYEKRGKAGCGI